MTVNGKSTAPATVESPSLRTLQVHKDDRGNVREVWRESWGTPPVKQMVRSFSRAGVLRGLHHHRKQWDIWTFVAGMATVQLYDPQTAWHKSIAVADASLTIIIPPGISHGFQAITDCTLLYGLTEEYTGDDEYGFQALYGWPGAGLWLPGTDKESLSERDKNAPPLATFLRTL